MSSKYIDGTYSNGYTLSGIFQSITIGPNGAVHNSGVTGGNAEAYTIVNGGWITGDIVGDTGIALEDGGAVTNTASGTITGNGAGYNLQAAGGDGVLIAGGAGLIDNSGTITGGFGSPDFGVGHGYGEGYGGIGVSITGGAGTVHNSGTISGGMGGRAQYGDGGAGGVGVNITGDGTITNNGVISGGAGGYNNSRGYGANAGGAAIIIVGAGTIDNSAIILGGAGGDVYANNVGGGGIGINITGVGTIDNSGIISGGAGGSTSNAFGGGGGDGIDLADGGTIYNRLGGLITGGSGGSGGQRGGYFVYGGNGGAGVDFSGAAGTVGNHGTIAGGAFGISSTGNGAAGTGIVLGAGGTVVNYSGGLITGGIGVAASGNYTATVVNYGTIEGTGGTSVLLGSTGGVVVAESGADFIGTIVGSGGTLELAGGSGTVTGLGATGTFSGGDSGTFTGFGSYVIGAGGSWTFTGTNAVGSGQALEVDGTLINSGTLTDSGTVTISSGGALVDNGLIKLNGGVLIEDGSFSGGGTIDLTNSATLDLGVSVSGATIDFNDGSLLVLNQNGDYSGVSVKDFASGDGILLNDIFYAVGDTATYHNGQLYLLSGSGGTLAHFATTMTQASDPLAVQSNNGKAEIVDNAACYCAGTMILTDRGEVRVEDLKIGDMVVTVSGAARPITWIGRRSYAGRFANNNPELLPIRFKAGSIAENVPTRDLQVSPRHAMYLEGMLIPAKHLVNGMSVIRADRVDELQYFHIELASHDILLANGAASESYIDLDNRRMFENWASYEGLTGATAEYAPRLWTGAAWEAARAAILARLPNLGFVAMVDRAPHLVADGIAIRPEAVEGSLYRFRLAAPVSELRLVSHAAVPAALGAGTDRRRLGVPLAGLAVRTRGMTLTIDHAEPALAIGFHAAEATHRWTDGNALLPDIAASLCAEGTVIELRIPATNMPCRVEANAA